MTDKLNWDYYLHDFSPLKETIRKYFPVDNPEFYDENSIESFQGRKEIEEILHENFFTTKKYAARWGKFRKFLKQELKKPIHESMIAWYPCYSGFITLKKEKNKNITYFKELHFFVSLLGPYYTIMGVDRSEVSLEAIWPAIKEDEKIVNRKYFANYVLTVSPYLEYKEPFLMLQSKILEYFPSLRYIPYSINEKKAEGISLCHPNFEGKIKDSVFSALFKPDDLFNTETRGEINFGFDEWLKVKKPDKNRIRQIQEALLEKSLKSGSKLTIHKVWKLKAVKRIPLDIPLGLFGMDLFKVLDLTEKNYLTIVFNEDNEPSSSSYSIADNEINIEQFQDKLKLKIETLTVNELKLILHIDLIIYEKEIIKGDIFELIFEVYK